MRVCFGPGILIDSDSDTCMVCLANRQPEGCVLRVHCKALVGGSLMFEEDAKDFG
jgi:hypothetical protein